MLTTRPLTELTEALRAGDISATELMRETLDQIDRLNPTLNAIVSLRDRGALLAEAENPRPGLLSGIPMAIKDLTETAGLRTTHGSATMADHVPMHDDRLARRLKDAGAIIIGKTNTPEFGVGSQTFNDVFGRTLNPYDQGRTCGGSSGGASVAVASGMLPVADGSDMMGSLRNPAAWANIYGLRPTVGLIPRDMATSTDLPLSTDGAMARHPGDLALMLEVLGGPQDGWPFDVKLSRPTLALNGAKIGWIGDAYGLPFEDGLIELCKDALDQMQDAGAGVSFVDQLPFDRDLAWTSWTTLRAALISSQNIEAYSDPSKRSRMKATVIWEIEKGLALSKDQIGKAKNDRQAVLKSMETALETFDVLALPTTQVWPFPVDEEYPMHIAGQDMDTYHRWMEAMIAASLPGLPAMSLPAGFGKNGLPAGISLIGRPGSDLDLIAIAEDWDRLTSWPSRRPPVVA